MTLGSIFHIPYATRPKFSICCAHDQGEGHGYIKGLGADARYSLLSLQHLVLDHDEEQVLVGSDENLLSLAADAEERQVIERVNITHDRSGLLGELRDFLCVQLGRRLIVAGAHGRLEEFTVFVDDKETLDALVALDALNALIDFRHAVICIF